MRAYGVDISHWQENWKYQGEDFVIQKVTEGWSWTDPKFEEYLPEVQKAPIRGAYHYFRTVLDPIAQASHFVRKIKGCGYHFLVVDYEKTNNTLDRPGAENLKIFWDKVVSLTDHKLFLYTSPYIYRDNLCVWSDFWLSVPLWMAHYNGEDPQSGSPTLFDAPGWKLWQYTSTPLDQNVYNGSVKDMEDYLGIGEEPMKKPWESKTIIFFILSLLVAIAGLFGFAEFQPTAEMAQIITIVVSIAGIILRAITEKKVGL